MKKIHLIVLLILPLAGLAQSHPCFVKYTYDDSGNRIKREFVCEEDPITNGQYYPTGIVVEGPDENDNTTSSGNNATMIALLDTTTQDTLSADLYTLIYPNPNAGIFWIDFKQEVSGARVYILDDLGQMVLRTETDDILTHIDISQHSPGTYFVVIYDGDKTHSHKVEVIR